MLHQLAKRQDTFGVVLEWLLDGGDALQVKTTVESLAPTPGAAVLEVGFGAGATLEALAKRQRLGLVAGADPSGERVARARRRLDGGRGDAALDLRVGEPDHLPFPDESFDLVYAVNVFHAWPDLAGGLAEMVGVLRPAGDLVLSVRDLRHDGHGGLGAEVAARATALLRDFGLQVRTREVVHSPKRATLLVRGRKCGRRTLAEFL